LKHVPGTTKWYEVRALEDAHLNELRVIGHCGWDDRRDANELSAVAGRKPATLASSPQTWDPLVLWGHTADGPFTILEGNNRLVAYASGRSKPGLGVPVFVGLSTDPCHWHLPDPLQ
jgi:hypothetical protein